LLLSRFERQPREFHQSAQPPFGACLGVLFRAML
jgi:hypothetical protein